MAVAAVLIAACPSAKAQSFNLDIGLSSDPAPSASYGAAANQPGHWMKLPCTQGVSVFNLVDINGVTTNARLSQIGGTQNLTVNDPALSGDDAILMNDYLITFTTVENCLFFRDMQPGGYEVFIYARMPAQPGVKAYTSVDQEPGFPHHEVGGDWPGHHQEFVSYAKHTAFVEEFGVNAGKLYLHSGIAPGGSLAIGAAINGVQIRKTPSCHQPADITCDGSVGVPDLLAVIAAWGPCTVPNLCVADIAPAPSGDGVVGVPDLLAVIANWN